MGQQQLLLIVLGVIIVGIAIVVGINLFNANAEESAKDTLVSEGTNLGAMAQQFYKKPVALGGGGNAFTTTNGAPNDWSIPANLVETAGGSWSITGQTDDEVILTGEPDDSYDYSWSVEVTVTPTGITSEILGAN